MGVEIIVNGNRTELTSYSVSESSTPLSGSDSSGSVGTIRLTAPHFRGDQLLINKAVTISDSFHGVTLGTVRKVSPNLDSALQNFDAELIFGSLNFDMQVQPFTGTVKQAVQYYLGLGNITTDIMVSPEFADDPIDVPGWFGNLWVGMKRFAAAIDAEFALVNNAVVFRRIRTRTVRNARDISRNSTIEATEMAQQVEVYYYNNDYRTNALAYPTGGWTAEVSPLTVPAGESIQHKLTVDVSLDYLKQPTCVTNVSKTYAGPDSVFTVTGSDGLPITPAQWTNFGGKLSVSIGEDTKTILVDITGPSGLVQSNGEPQRQFSLALPSGTSTNQTYSTLRIVGDGVFFNKQLLTVPTGLTDSDTSNVVGATVDSPYISTLEQAYTVGLRTARTYSGQTLSIGGSVASVNNIGDTGLFGVKSYGDVQLDFAGQAYADIQSVIQTLYGTYGDFQLFTASNTNPNVENQTFGNVAGARVFDYDTARWYRVREATVTPDDISFDAEDDMTMGDADTGFAGLTVGEVDAMFAGRTHFDASLLGLTYVT